MSAGPDSAVLAIETQALGKAYRQYGRALDRGLELATLGAWKRHREFQALSGLDLAVARGESLGVIGQNGAGKSTLLKLLAGIAAPSSGRLRVRGRVAGLLELGAGFHLDLSGRENIALAGALFGLSRREVREREGEVLEFAEIGEFVDQPVRTYSTGMAVRLSFAVATAVDPDVLIVDELFAVGDMYFQKKCVDRVLDFQRRGKTIVLCSHSLYDVRQLCGRALWLERGTARALGDAVAVTNDYAAFQREHIARVAPASSSARAGVGREPHVVDACLFRVHGGEEAWEVESGESLELRVWWHNPQVERGPIQLGVGFLRQDRTLCAAAATHLDGLALAGERGCAVLELPEIALLSGTFAVLVVVFDASGVHRYQELTLPESLVVRARTRELGLFRMSHRWRLDSGAPPEEQAARPRAAEERR